MLDMIGSLQRDEALGRCARLAVEKVGYDMHSSTDILRRLLAFTKDS